MALLPCRFRSKLKPLAGGRHGIMRYADWAIWIFRARTKKLKIKQMRSSKPAVVILNMSYTGVAIARNLRHQHVPILGVTAKRDIFGNHTRCAEVLFAPDSAEAPEELASFLVQLAKRFSSRPVLFATRDQDVSFIEHFRQVLERFYLLPIPAPGVLNRLLDKWETASAAKAAGIPVPQTYRLGGAEEVRHALLRFPCVVKPISSLEWRGQREWMLIGRRKAFAVESYDALLSEYATIEKVTPDILVQELIPGPDSNLYTFGCYFDRHSRLKGSFFGRKLLQYPAGFGTGFVVESAAPSIVGDYSVRLLQSIKYCGVAECEFKLDPRDNEFKLIEVNARHWDQHGLSTACGANLSELAYLDMCQEDVREQVAVGCGVKWIAEDSFLQMGAAMVLQRNIRLADLLRTVSGKRVYGLFDSVNPAPFVFFFVCSFLPSCLRKIATIILSCLRRERKRKEGSQSRRNTTGTGCCKKSGSRRLGCGQQ